MHILQPCGIADVSNFTMLDSHMCILSQNRSQLCLGDHLSGLYSLGRKILDFRVKVMI